jgi:hypothetical protein
MPGIGLAPGGAMAMKDVCDLKPWAAHGRRLGAGYRPFFGRRREPIERAGHSTDRGVGHAGVKGRGVELGMAERTRAIMRTFYVIEIESSPERDSMLANDAALSCHTRAGPLP